jgi:hypothetical protein
LPNGFNALAEEDEKKKEEALAKRTSHHITSIRFDSIRFWAIRILLDLGFPQLIHSMEGLESI